MSRRVLATLTALAALSAAAWANAQTTIVDLETHSCLEMHHGDAGTAAVVQSTCGGRRTQLFSVIEQPDGYALVGNGSPEECLSAPAIATTAGAVLVSAPCSAKDTGQMFKPIPQDGGGYALLNRRSGLCISNGGNTAIGGHPSLLDCESKAATPYRMSGWQPSRPTGPSKRVAEMAHSENRPATKGLVLSGLDIKGDYTLYGSKFDGATLTNSTITGALKIDGVQKVYVHGNHLNSIWFRGQEPTDDVTIEGNEIAGAANDCIHIHEGAAPPTHVVIENNDIHDCGVKYPASGLYHAIYDQVPDVLIKGNHIWNAKSAVSIRSSAAVEGNTIERVTNGGAIEYFSDHGAPDHSSLVLRNNVIRSTVTNAPGALGTNRGLVTLGNGIGTNRRAVFSFVLEHNTFEVLNAARDDSGTYFVVYTQMAIPNAKLSNNRLITLIPDGEFIGPIPVKAESNDVRSHVPE
jgi:hypothetical protein